MAKTELERAMKGVLNLNLIQDGPFWGCSWMGEGQKGSSLKSVTHILQ